MRMYQMALDNVSETNRIYRHWIRRNMAYTQLVQHQYDAAMRGYEQLVQEHPDMPSAFNLILCYRALGDPALMREGFTRLLSVDSKERSSQIRGLNDTNVGNRDSGVSGAALLADILAPAQEDREQLKDELGKEQQRRSERSTRFILQAAKVIIPVIGGDILASYDYIAGVLRSEGYGQLAGQIEMAKAIECLQRGETSIAVDMLRGFTRDSSSGMAGSALQNLSFVLQLEGDIVHAEHAAQQALDKEPFNTHALVQLGNIRYGQEKYEEALDLYNKALNADPGYTIAEYNAGLTLKHLQKFTEARERFERLSRRHPHDTDVMLQLAESIAAQGRDFEKSRRLFAEVNTRIPSDASVLMRLGQLVAQKDENKALFYYQEAFRYNPSSLDACGWLGYHFVKAYDFNAAAPYFEQAIRIDPNAKFFILLGSCYRKMGEKETALETYSRAHERYPQNTDVLKYLIASCKECGKNELASQYEAKQNAIHEEEGNEGINQQNQGNGVLQQREESGTRIEKKKKKKKKGSKLIGDMDQQQQQYQQQQGSNNVIIGRSNNQNQNQNQMFGEQNDNDDSQSPVRQGNQSKAITPTSNQQQQQQGQGFGIPMSLGVGSAVKSNKGQVIGQNVGIKSKQQGLQGKDNVVFDEPDEQNW
ncbi:MAG: putative intraflagellar transport protein ift88 [Streblomastix strix]|uniref:Putative intraflagellar transport protein ift88 n=2 Tax=Streblomastix strix TaxID=222440 RepID=A0A5J4U4R6_9EUKA|nr:MAG: putative intraflagellar transport protein ift88 [Streblomastix strix]